MTPTLKNILERDLMLCEELYLKVDVEDLTVNQLSTRLPKYIEAVEVTLDWVTANKRNAEQSRNAKLKYEISDFLKELETILKGEG